MMTTPPRAALVSVTKRFAGTIALDDLSCEVAPGDIFGFLGPNGAGKTTAMRILVGLAKATSGQAFIDGHVAGTLEARRSVGYVPDNPALYDRLTGYEMIALTCDLFGVETAARDHIEDLITALALEAVADRLISTYSRGMRQKLSVVCAFVHKPKILFLDEPMVGLDPEGVVRLRDILTNTAREGNAVFLSTHQIELASALCTRVAIIDHGRTIVSGSVGDICREYNSDGLEEAFLNATNTGTGGITMRKLSEKRA